MTRKAAIVHATSPERIVNQKPIAEIFKVLGYPLDSGRSEGKSDSRPEYFP